MWILLLLLIIFFCWLVGSMLLDTEKNKYNIEWAADMLEVAVKLAKQQEPSCVELLKSEDEFGYLISFQKPNTSHPHILQEILNQNIGQWKIIKKPNNDYITVQYESASGYIGSWNTFRKAVWKEIKKRHPHWKIQNNQLFV